MMSNAVVTISAPASKSSSLRALISCLLAENSDNYTIHNISLCDDVMIGIELICDIKGFSYTFEQDRLILRKAKNKIRDRSAMTLNVGESGFLARVFVSLATLYSDKFRLVGRGTLIHRDLGLTTFLDKIGLITSDAKLPTTIQGQIKPGKFYIAEENSSQFLSGLLFTLPLLAEDSLVIIGKMVSKPYIDLTLSYLGKCGINFQRNNKTQIVIKGNQRYQVKELRPESDWSSLSYLICLGVISRGLIISNIIDNPLLPDRVILNLLDDIGGKCTFLDSQTLKVEKSEIAGFNFDLTSNPDLAPVLVALAICATNPSKLSGCYRLRNKESDRLSSIIEMLKVLKVIYFYSDDCLTIYPSKLTGGIIKSYDDHRIAMTALILNAISEEKISIDNYQCINKSYPDFLKDLKRLGVEI